MGFSNYAGGFSDVSGSLTLDSKNPAASKLSVKIPSPRDDHQRQAHRRAQGRPVARRREVPDHDLRLSTKVAPAGKDHAKVTGDLTLHGVTKPVTLDVTLVGAAPTR